MTVRVTAPLVVAPDAAGLLRYRYRGAVLGVDDIDAEAAARLIDDGMVERVPFVVFNPGDEDTGDSQGQPGASGDGGQAGGDNEGQAASAPPAATVAERPKKTAPAAEWEAYAVARGMSPEDAAALTRAELIAKFAEA
ncbi:hypothetical protein [Nocardia sp. IFM 10818]